MPNLTCACHNLKAPSPPTPLSSIALPDWPVGPLGSPNSQVGSTNGLLLSSVKPVLQNSHLYEQWYWWHINGKMWRVFQVCDKTVGYWWVEQRGRDDGDDDDDDHDDNDDDDNDNDDDVVSFPVLWQNGWLLMTRAAWESPSVNGRLEVIEEVMQAKTFLMIIILGFAFFLLQITFLMIIILWFCFCANYSNGRMDWPFAKRTAKFQDF